MKRVGLALGGGAARGLAHIGVLRALKEEKRYQPVIVAGTSAGSIMAAMYACEIPQDTIETVGKEFDWFRHVLNIGDTLRNFFERKGKGLVSNEKLGRTLNELIGGKKFSDLSIDLAITASDLENGSRIIFTSEKVAHALKREVIEHYLPRETEGKPGCETLIVSDWDDIGMAVRASCAVPGIFQPVCINNMTLVDGGLLDQVPVDIVRAMGARFTIGVSLTKPFGQKKGSPGRALLPSLVGVMSLQQVRKSLELADIGFQISGIGDRSFVDPHQHDLIEIGYNDMKHWIKQYEQSRRGLRIFRKV